MKSAKVFFIFGFIGLGLVILGGVMASKSAALLHDGATAVGTVLEVSETRYTDNKGKSKRKFLSTISYAPSSGVPTTFTQDGDFGKGARVDVVYLPSDPSSAKVNSFSSIWGATAGFTCIGLIFGLVGFGGAFSVIKRERAIEQLLASGACVKATVVGIDRHTSSGKHRRRTSYRLIVRAVEQVAGLPAELRSEYLSRAPDDSIIGSEVEVLYDAANPCSYFVNLRESQ